MMHLSIIIVSYNTKSTLSRCLTAVSEQLADYRSEVLVIDNHSSDGSADIVEAEFPWVHLIRNSANDGFAKAVNIGLSAASGAFCLLLNSDAILLPGALNAIVRFAEEHPDAGIVGGLQIGSDGKPARISAGSRPTLWRVICHETCLAHVFRGQHPFHGLYMYSHSPDVKEVEWVSGAFLLLRAAATEAVGILDERYFMYGEDVDLCTRMWKAGWKVYHCPAARVVHSDGTSLKKVKDARVLAAVAQSKALALRLQLGKAYPVANAIIVVGHMCRLLYYAAALVFTGSQRYSARYARVWSHLRSS